MIMLSEQVKHLELIQNVISRMSGNCFLLKGWSVTLGAALLGLTAKESNPKFALIALFPPIVFWGADAYYLRQERLFRKLYDRIRELTDAQWPDSGKFDMSTSTQAPDVPTWTRSLLDASVCGIHLTVLVIVLVILILFRSSR
jgi:hypothetical protein